MAPREVVVIGAGIAGLTAAHALAKRGKQYFRITLLEAEPEPGGQARAFDIDGVTVEHGSHVFFNYYRTIIQIIDELRDDPMLAARMPALVRVPGWTICDANGKRATLQHSTWLPAPYAVAPSVMRIPWLGFREKLRVLLASKRLIDQPYDRFPELDQSTSYQLGRFLGYSEDGIDTWNAASLGLTNMFVQEQSAALLCAKHKVLIGTPDGLSYRLPAGNLSNLIANPMRLAVEKMGGKFVMRAEATQIDRIGDRTRVHYWTPEGVASIDADHVILAVPPQAAHKLLPEVKAPWTELQKVSPVITAVSQLSGRLQQSSDDREVGCSREHWTFSVVTDLSRFWPEFMGDKTVLRFEIGHADMLPSGIDTSDDELVKMLKQDIGRLYPEARPMSFEWTKFHREAKHLYTRWGQGQWSKKPTQRNVGMNVYLAGDWTTKGTIGMEAAANSGIEAANHILLRNRMPEIPFTDIPL